MECHKRVENGKDNVTLHLDECLHLHVGKDPMVGFVSLDIYANQKSCSRYAYINNIFGNHGCDASYRKDTLESGNYCFGILELGRKERNQHFN